MYWMGIDVGSISTDLVLMDNEGVVKESRYLKTGSRPIQAVQEGLKSFGEGYDSSKIRGVGITGSGRYLGAAIVGADVVKNEITTHGRAAVEVDPAISTVIEIGGQDSKIIILKNGMVSDFAMNTVCAAGTGSFLDRQASRMGISVEELGDMAAAAKTHVTIAGRCAVFAESDLIHKQQLGTSEDVLMAGMCHALAGTYMANVAKGKHMKDKICFQGGVAANKGMKKAFEDLLNRPVFVPEHHKIMGAYGAALMVREKKPSRTRFKGFDQGKAKLDLKEMRCDDCSNHCVVTVIEADGIPKGYFGDRCGKHTARGI